MPDAARGKWADVPASFKSDVLKHVGFPLTRKGENRQKTEIRQKTICRHCPTITNIKCTAINTHLQYHRDDNNQISTAVQ